MDSNNIIDELYKVLNFLKPIKINNVCTECCMDIDNARLLLIFNLNAIPLELIQNYNDGAQAVKFDMNEFKYFLPRYLELIYDFQFTSEIDLCLSLKNLNFNNKECWLNPDEIKLINDFAFSFFERCLKEKVKNNEFEIIDILNMFFKSGISIDDLLFNWVSNLSNISILHLNNLIVNNFNQRGKFINSPFFDSEFKSIIEKCIINNKDKITNAIEDQIMNDKLGVTERQELSYLYDFIRYV